MISAPPGKTLLMPLNNNSTERERERGDNGLFITQVPKVL